jgi:altronate dehydratase large subunit
MNFWGYKRPDGRVGIRNHILILPASVCATDTCRIVSEQVTGTVTFHNQNGCSQTPLDLKYTMDVMAGFAANPNIYGIVAISLGCEGAQMDMLVKEIRKRTNKPLKTLIIQEVGGTIKTAEKAVRYASKMVEEASMLRKEEFPVSKLIVGTECGGSDPTSGLAANNVVGELSDRLVELGSTSILSETTELIGAEHILAKRVKDETVKNRIYEIIERYENNLHAVGQRLRNANPSPGNITGGLTTIEEKSLGCIHKGGHTDIQEVVDYAQETTQKGLIIMDTPGNDPASIAGMVAGGAQIVVFTTGRGTPTGNPIAPVIKITGNKITYKKMIDNIDFDASAIIYGEATLEELGDKLLKEVIAVANGKVTKAEALNFMEIGMMRTCNYV